MRTLNDCQIVLLLMDDKTKLTKEAQNEMLELLGGGAARE